MTLPIESDEIPESGRSARYGAPAAVVVRPSLNFSISSAENFLRSSSFSARTSETLVSGLNAGSTSTSPVTKSTAPSATSASLRNGYATAVLTPSQIDSPVVRCSASFSSRALLAEDSIRSPRSLSVLASVPTVRRNISYLKFSDVLLRPPLIGLTALSTRYRSEEEMAPDASSESTSPLMLSGFAVGPVYSERPPPSSSIAATLYSPRSTADILALLIRDASESSSSTIGCRSDGWSGATCLDAR